MSLIRDRIPADVATAAPRPAAPSVAVIGAGPRAVGWLERFAANRYELGDGRPVVVHLIDPSPPGGGRIWRFDQSPLLKLNSLAADVTMFTDASCAIEGPVLPGPSLIEWAEQVHTGSIADVTVRDAGVASELASLSRDSFPTRRLQSVYLDWFFRRARAVLGDDVELRVHADRAVRVDGDGDARQHVVLASGAVIDVDLVLYAVGHNGSAPDAETERLAGFADRHGLTYLPPSFTADADTSALGPGQTVVVRGFGLAAVDLIVLLTEGRGGRFSSRADGSLHYTPSGREPRLVIGSRRGVPYHSKIASTLVGERPPLRFFTAEIAATLARESTRLDFRADVWPLIAKEMLHGYYAELFTGHPTRVRSSWPEFVERFEHLDPFGPGLARLVEETVPDPDDRLDLASFDRPLDGVRVESAEALQEEVRAYIRRDLRLRTLPEHSATLGLFTSLLFSLFALSTIIDAPNWSARSRMRDLQGWWPGYFSFVASGPPGHRLEELLALSDAGIVEFLGSGTVIETDDTHGVFRASGANVERSVEAAALVDAWLPPSRAALSDSAVLRALIESGHGIEHIVSDADFSGNTGLLTVRPTDSRVIDATGSPHPRRYAIGPYTTVPFAGAFSRPGTNAIAFRENDASARAVLRHLGALRDAPSAVRGARLP
ncbi:FAD/NAD(P)-binding protein [Leifsonia sp. NPDC058292]|uniref:FAD/NAD(P)-binding protein n=1 Tax=Leifsonia sp. NPDC058292 TaxID=3346428 RepID=UPI0036DE5472